MNITELARILKITPQELRDKLPQIGFDIGKRAIKIDNRTAQKIIKEWPKLIKQLEAEQEQTRKKEKEETEKMEKKVIKVPSLITVREFASIAELPVNKILSELMKNGIFISLNEKIDFDTASIIGSDLNLDVQPAEEGEDAKHSIQNTEKEKLNSILKNEDDNNLKVRPPVIVVMGHVDHGKTKLLDAIRKSNVIEGEAGGITQHIGAYQVVKNNRTITFIDTPGHEAFTAMRSRGAKIADVAILVVAADDGVKPQTIEAFHIIEATGIPYIVAINKIDKPEADVIKTKQELSTKLNITPEDWGGKIICSEISAKEGTGIDELLDMILLTADIDSENRKANPNSPAVGTVIESHVDKGAGPVATLLVQNGTLRIGDPLTFEGKLYGKVRALKDYKGKNIQEAGPSQPVMIIGLKIAPEVGDILQVGEGEKIKIKKIKQTAQPIVTTTQEEDESNIKKINIILKSDVLGSAEAIEESLEKINTEEIKAKIIYKGLGNITEGDVEKAEGSNAIILGFNVKTPPQVENIIREKNIEVKIFNIIYDLIEYVKDKMEKELGVEIVKTELGKLKVAAIFRTEKTNQILGGKVIEGKIEAGSLIEVYKNKEKKAEGKLLKLQAGKQDVNEVNEGEECGIQYEGKPIIKKGDILHFYKEEKIAKKL